MNVTGIIWRAIRAKIQEKESLLHDCFTLPPAVLFELHVGSRTMKSEDPRTRSRGHVTESAKTTNMTSNKIKARVKTPLDEGQPRGRRIKMDRS